MKTAFVVVVLLMGCRHSGGGGPDAGVPPVNSAGASPSVDHAVPVMVPHEVITTARESPFIADYEFAKKNKLKSKMCDAAHMIVVGAILDRDQAAFDNWRPIEHKTCADKETR